MTEQPTATGEPEETPAEAQQSHRRNTAYVTYRDAPTGTVYVIGGVRPPRPKPPIAD
jgi:hypothetical protein